MKHPMFTTTLGQSILCGVLAGLIGTLPTQPAMADDELRAGAVLQVPFTLGADFSGFDPARIRIGLTCQYAHIEEDQITTLRTIDVTDPDNPLVMHASTQIDEGDQVHGLEGNLFIEVFNGFNGSAELLGFYGNNDIQGAAGAGYSVADSFFLAVKAMFPYAEIGMRIMNHPEIYGGVKSLGSFDPAKESQTIDQRVRLVPVR